jgi:hypothetical protein
MYAAGIGDFRAPQHCEIALAGIRSLTIVMSAFAVFEARSLAAGTKLTAVNLTLLGDTRLIVDLTIAISVCASFFAHSSPPALTAEQLSCQRRREAHSGVMNSR